MFEYFFLVKAVLDFLDSNSYFEIFIFWYFKNLISVTISIYNDVYKIFVVNVGNFLILILQVNIIIHVIDVYNIEF